MLAAQAPLPPVSLPGGMLETITAALRHDGVAIIADAVPTEVLTRLLARAERDGEFVEAGIGRHRLHQTRADIRRDRIRWLDPDDEGTRWYLAWAELLRAGLNEQLFLGLFDYEAHLAWYPEGAYYRTHVDTFATTNAGRSARTISTVLYLNPRWQPSDGGELVLYPSLHAAEASLGDGVPATERIVAPEFGTLVLFLSDEFPHEVLPVSKPRFSVAGWFRTNAHSVLAVDPPMFDPPGS